MWHITLNSRALFSLALWARFFSSHAHSTGERLRPERSSDPPEVTQQRNERAEIQAPPSNQSLQCSLDCLSSIRPWIWLLLLPRPDSHHLLPGRNCPTAASSEASPHSLHAACRPDTHRKRWWVRNRAFLGRTPERQSLALLHSGKKEGREGASSASSLRAHSISQQLDEVRLFALSRRERRGDSAPSHPDVAEGVRGATPKHLRAPVCLSGTWDLPLGAARETRHTRPCSPGAWLQEAPHRLA